MQSYCSNCKHGELDGLNVKCSKILESVYLYRFIDMYKEAGVQVVAHYILTSLTFSCAEHEPIDDTTEEEIM